ncbi:MAG: glutathione S-transferase family protein [Methylobacteriaceae bacterium]|nr:glutathione S-transferase family protein [Methylobacteriaceae bacterium]
MTDRVTLWHGEPSRSSMTKLLLDELGAPYDVVPLDLKAGDQLKPEFLAINPMGKVPTIRHNGAIVAETVAIFIYLADAFPQARLAPAIGDPDRGPYLRWLVFYGACFEPAIMDRFLKREPAQRATSPYADYDTTIAALRAALTPGPYILGDRFSAADLLWGAALDWTTRFGLVETTPEIAACLARHRARPAVRAQPAAS